MSRVQLALNVGDLDQAIAFYTKLFGTGPAKIREGYANFAIAEPPLKLVLFAGGEPGTINHLGVEVENTDLVGEAITRLQAEGLATDIEEKVDCCFAVQDKVWVSGPDTTRWEVYTVLADSPVMKGAAEGADGAVCCSPAADEAPAAEAAVGCCGPVTASAPVAMAAPATVSTCC